MKRIGITGSSGYIGRQLCMIASASGWGVVRIGRRAIRANDRIADINRPYEPNLIDGLDAIVHLAFDNTGDDQGDSPEILFAENLAIDCRKRGVTLVFVSSQAVEGGQASSAYAMTKQDIERRVLPHGAIVIRPGMVYGGAELGLWGALVKLTRVSFVLPDLGANAFVQPIHVKDLSVAILRACSDEICGSIVRIAGSPISFTEFMKNIVRYRLGKFRLFVPVPVSMLRKVLQVMELFAGPRFSPSRLDSLVSLSRMDTGRDMDHLGLVPRAIEVGMSKSGEATRRELLYAMDKLEVVIGPGSYPWAVRRLCRVMRSLTPRLESTCLEGREGLYPAVRVAESTLSTVGQFQPAANIWMAFWLLLQAMAMEMVMRIRMLF